MNLGESSCNRLGGFSDEQSAWSETHVSTYLVNLWINGIEIIKFHIWNHLKSVDF